MQQTLQRTDLVGWRRTGSPHQIIEGDNLSVLTSMMPGLGGTVDLIYVDPPYNTGYYGRKYNDKFTAWADFMIPRLRLARQALTELGVIAIAIDDTEHARLRTIMDDIFGPRNFLTNIVWQGHTLGDGRFTGGGLDYMVVYGRDKAAMVKADIRWRESKVGLDAIFAAAANSWQRSEFRSDGATYYMRDWWKVHKGEYSPGLREYSRIDDAGRVFRIGHLGQPTGRGCGTYPLLHPVTGRPVKQPSGEWVCTQETMARYIEEGRIQFGPDETTIPHRKLYLEEQSTQSPAQSFTHQRDGGTDRLTSIFGETRFANPKDPSVLARWFEMMASSEATILDFFAGSGSTADAVFQLNASDGGSRRCILVTNNEVSAVDAKRLRAAGVEPGEELWEAAGVFRHVTAPRVRTLVTGIREDGSRFSDGFDEAVEFLQLVG